MGSTVTPNKIIFFFLSNKPYHEKVLFPDVQAAKAKITLHMHAF